MYGKNPNHANKFRRFFNKKYPPGSRFVVYSAISAGCIGPPAGGYIGRPAGFLCPCRGPDEKTVRRCSAMVRKHCKCGSGRAGDRPGAFRNIRDPLRAGAFGAFGEGAFGMFGGSPGGGVRNVRREGVWHVRRLSWRGRSGRSESLRTEALRNIRNPLRTGRSGADCSFGPFADGSDADRTVSGCGYLISRSGCSRRKCSQLCDPLREAAFLPPPSPLTRSGPRAAWSGLEVV